MHRHHTLQKIESLRHRVGDSAVLRHLDNLVQQAGDVSEYVDELAAHQTHCRAMAGSPGPAYRRAVVRQAS